MYKKPRHEVVFLQLLYFEPFLLIALNGLTLIFTHGIRNRKVT